jgi:hypothetical protein
LLNTKGAHPNSHLHLIRVHRAVIETQNAAQNRLKKRRATTTTHHAVGSRHRGDVARWNEALCSTTLPKAKSKTRSKQNKDMHKCSSVYSERGVPLPVLTSGGE